MEAEKKIFKSFKGILLESGPSPRFILLDGGVEGSNDVEEVGNELSVQSQ